MSGVTHVGFSGAQEGVAVVAEAGPERFEHDRRFRVAEVFGPTIQGEGAMIGRVTHFIRFGGCDYRCDWCDSPHAVLPHLVGQLQRLTVRQILAELEDLPGDPGWVTFSGGNPALLELGELVRAIHREGHLVGVETQGTVWTHWLNEVDQLTISPKPPSSGNATSVKVLGSFLAHHEHHVPACLKVVVFDEEDFDYAKRIHDAFPEYEFWVQVGCHDPNMPTVGNNNVGDANNPVDLSQMLSDLRWLSERVANDPDLGYARVTPQLHVLTWGLRRGV